MINERKEKKKKKKSFLLITDLHGGRSSSQMHEGWNQIYKRFFSSKVLIRNFNFTIILYENSVFFFGKKIIFKFSTISSS